MEIGFETIGNATLICHDQVPVLITDPWIAGSAYFGSWIFSHEIPEEQLQSIAKAQYAWISHGHPDHLSRDSLPMLRDKTILLPNHVGGRIAADLKQEGYRVQVMQDRTWYKLSDRIRVLCIADYYQDGILLIDVNGRLLADLNDTSDRGWGPFVRNTITQYKTSFLLHLSGFGDADMINCFDEQGQRIPPPAAKKLPVGKQIAFQLAMFPTRYFIPFSSMHRYQREDSVWAEEYTTKLSDYPFGFDSKTSELLPAFIRYDCANDTYVSLAPPERSRSIRSPAEFGDDWEEQLDAVDVQKITRYFRAIEHLSGHFDFLNFRVGKKDHIVELSSRKFHRAITFEVPRHSLMTAIHWEIFDDLLIGNFMKTTLHGSFSKTGLYPDFTPYVAKYADNGRAKSKEELEAYFTNYRQRAPFEFLRARIESLAKELIRGSFDPDSSVYHFARRTYVAALKLKSKKNRAVIRTARQRVPLQFATEE
ncbi:MAG: hypothetical protein JWO91_1114 [Acidobacteriaceae bacterium]|nr:hypothetical protein [Acidobacteriaceae bacterium]